MNTKKPNSPSTWDLRLRPASCELAAVWRVFRCDVSKRQLL